MASRVHVVTGKGGVVKTTAATALGLALARRGKRVLLAEVNGGERVTTLLEANRVGSEMREVLEGLHVVDMNPRDAIHEYALLTFRFEAVYSAVFENRFVKHFLRLVPSLSELVMLGKLWFHHEEQREDGTDRFDHIVIDAPATGHAISMLRAPHVVQRTVPPGPLRDNAKNIATMLSERSVMHVVTTPEEMPVNEARELERAAADLIGITMGTTFINQRLTALDPEAIPTLMSQEQEWVAALGRALDVRQSKQKLGEEQLERLPNIMLRDAVTFPRLVNNQFRRDSVETLAQIIFEHFPVEGP
ncbi:MAG: ArsA-related P-loop ATPase [Myxococcota bacterium]